VVVAGDHVETEVTNIAAARGTMRNRSRYE